MTAQRRPSAPAATARGVSRDEFEERMDGDAIRAASDALTEEILFFPIRRFATRWRSRRTPLRPRWSRRLRRHPQCAGILGADPAPFTLRELAAMAEARQRAEWDRAAMLCATLVNVNRDPRRGKPARPEDFNPYRRRKQQCIQMDRAETMSFLREFAQGAAQGMWNKSDGWTQDGIFRT